MTKRKKKKSKKKKKKKPMPAPPPQAPEGESVLDMIRRHAKASGRVSITKKLKGLEEKPLPDTITPLEIEDDLDELLGEGHD